MRSKPRFMVGASRRPRQSDRRKPAVKLLLYTIAIVVYPTEAWGHAFGQAREANTAFAWLTLAVYHTVVVQHVLHDFKKWLKALCGYSRRCLLIIWRLRCWQRRMDTALSRFVSWARRFY